MNIDRPEISDSILMSTNPPTTLERLLLLNVGAYDWFGDCICERLDHDVFHVVSFKSSVKGSAKRAATWLECLEEESESDADEDS